MIEFLTMYYFGHVEVYVHFLMLCL